MSLSRFRQKAKCLYVQRKEKTPSEAVRLYSQSEFSDVSVLEVDVELYLFVSSLLETGAVSQCRLDFGPEGDAGDVGLGLSEAGGSRRKSPLPSLG